MDDFDAPNAEKQDALVKPPAAPATAKAEIPVVRMSSAVWTWWLRIALERLKVAKEAREKAFAARKAGEDPAQGIYDEAINAMQAVSASAHAIDGFYGSVKHAIDIPKNLLDRWAAKPKTGRPGRIVETLKLGFKVGAHQDDWQRRVPELFDLRDASVHHKQELADSKPHPVGTNVSWDVRRYTLEAGKEAVSIAMDVIRECIENPKSSSVAVASQYKPGYAELAALHEELFGARVG